MQPISDDVKSLHRCRQVRTALKALELDVDSRAFFVIIFDQPFFILVKNMVYKHSCNPTTK